MQSKLMGLSGDSGGGIIFVRLYPGEELHASLKDLARRERIPGASLTGIGAVNDIVLALFDPATKTYRETRLTEDLEIVSMTGNLSWLDGEPVLHAHGVVSRADCTTAGGHIIRAVVSVTLEAHLLVGAVQLKRTLDPAFGLNLLALE